MGTRRDYMTVRNIGKRRGKSLYRDIKGRGKDQNGVLYYEFKGLLYRQILEQDVEIVREARKVVASQQIFTIRDKKTNEVKLMSLDKMMKPEKDDEILEIIREMNPEEGNTSIAVFDLATKDFIAILDVETKPDTNWCKAGVTFTFAKGKESFREKVKKDFYKICKDSGLFVDGIEEVTWKGNQPTFNPITQ